jgi:hypothetical protein
MLVKNLWKSRMKIPDSHDSSESGRASTPAMENTVAESCQGITTSEAAALLLES